MYNLSRFPQFFIKSGCLKEKKGETKKSYIPCWIEYVYIEYPSRFHDVAQNCNILQLKCWEERYQPKQFFQKFIYFYLLLFLACLSHWHSRWITGCKIRPSATNEQCIWSRNTELESNEKNQLSKARYGINNTESRRIGQISIGLQFCSIMLWF